MYPANADQTLPPPHYSTLDIVLTTSLVVVIVVGLAYVINRGLHKLRSGAVKKRLQSTKATHAGLESSQKWRKLQVLYITGSLLLIVGASLTIGILNGRERCEVTTTALTEHTYVPTGPRLGDNASVDYKVPEVSSSCSTVSERNEGISMGIVVWLVVALGLGYLGLPKLYRYLNPTQTSNKLSQ